MELEAYCMKCRAKRPISNAVAEYNAAGRPVTRGVCETCGTALYRMGETPAHASVPKAEKAVGDRETGSGGAGEQGSKGAGAKGRKGAGETQKQSPVSSLQSLDLKPISGPGEAVEAYCVKCREKRSMTEPRAEYTATGRPGTKGVCPVCGTTLYRPGETAAHAMLEKPSAEAATAARKAMKKIKVRRQKAEGSSQKAEGSSQKAEGSRQKAEGSSQKAEGSRQKSEGSSQKSVGSRQKAEGSSQKAEGSSQKSVGSRQKAESGRKIKDAGQRSTVSGRRSADVGRRSADDGQRSAASGRTAVSPMRGGKLVIVESPAKARTIGKFLGGGYRVRASIGHVRDLLKSQLSVDVDNNFEPKYRVPNEKKEIVKELTALAKGADQIFLATDPDREGEAIAWHLVEATKIDPGKVHRVEFHEITNSAIAEAFRNPRDINMQLVDAQQARRVLDRLVGYKISPILWDKVRSRLSAGRVQTVALRLVVEREREIQAFIPEEYWSLEAELAKKPTNGPTPRRQSFIAKLIKIGADKADLKNEADARAIVEALEGATYRVAKVEQKERRRYPSPPFTTSTLQQDASRRLGFNAKKTMGIAQQLYEGVDLGSGGTVGLITYMRTDSVNVSRQAQEEARGFISKRYGADYLPPQPPVYKTRAKGAQEAHEAIRPTATLREPAVVREHLTRDQARLYELIWKRFVASQMTFALLDVTTVDVAAPARYRPTPTTAGSTDANQSAIIEKEAIFRATGSVIKFEGFLAVYEVSREKEEPGEEGEGTVLPPLSVDEMLDLLRLIPEQHFTQPPPRYTEATLVKALEEHGIGRPSTYAAIITTIQQRGYVEREDRRLIPTELGFIVCDLLISQFPDVFDVGFTAQMESELDQIADGERPWPPVVRDFYGPFEKRVLAAEAGMEKVDLEPEDAGITCEKCGRPMIIKFGRFGKFIACSGFPECRNTLPYLERVGVTCPNCGGDLVEKRTKRGRVFYGCSNYPTCNFASWQKPLPQPCPHCGGLLTQASKTKAKCTKCERWTDLDRLETLPPGQGAGAPETGVLVT